MLRYMWSTPVTAPKRLVTPMISTSGGAAAIESNDGDRLAAGAGGSGAFRSGVVGAVNGDPSCTRVWVAWMVRAVNGTVNAACTQWVTVARTHRTGPFATAPHSEPAGTGTIPPHRSMTIARQSGLVTVGRLLQRQGWPCRQMQVGRHARVDLRPRPAQREVAIVSPEPPSRATTARPRALVRAWLLAGVALLVVGPAVAIAADPE